MRYHIKTGFNKDDITSLRLANNRLNALDWQYSRHCLDNLKHRVIDLRQVLEFIKGVNLDFSQVFEYYSEAQGITKVCYRINFNQYYDLILVLTLEKKIVTIYLNSVGDEHISLKKEIYNIPLTS